MLDIGCGSGVLAIAAVKLGAQSAIGIDIDPDALENARENAGLNDVGDRVRFEEGDFREMSLRADVVMANLTGGLLERSAATLGEMVAPGGFLIVSGFMETEKTGVVSALERVLELRTLAQEEEWLCAVLARSAVARSREPIQFLRASVLRARFFTRLPLRAARRRSATPRARASTSLWR